MDSELRRLSPVTVHNSIRHIFAVAACTSGQILDICPEDFEVEHGWLDADMLEGMAMELTECFAISAKLTANAASPNEQGLALEVSESEWYDDFGFNEMFLPFSMGRLIAKASPEAAIVTCLDGRMFANYHEAAWYIATGFMISVAGGRDDEKRHPVVTAESLIRQRKNRTWAAALEPIIEEYKAQLETEAAGALLQLGVERYFGDAGLLRGQATFRPRDAFIPNDHQQEILKALDGQALGKKQLSTAVRADGSRLYKPKPGSLHELRQLGLVKHRRGLGYYRPDRPPAVIDAPPMQLTSHQASTSIPPG